MLWLALAHLLLGTSLTLDSREFQAEYAKSGRAACKKCKVAIAKDSLRLARLVKSSHFDGVTPQWHHFSCLFKTNHWCSTEDDVIGFDNLRYEDQQRLETAMKMLMGGCWSAMQTAMGMDSCWPALETAMVIGGFCPARELAILMGG